MGILRLLLPALALGGCTTHRSEVSDEPPLTYLCNQAVVIGRLENRNYEHAPIENDLLGHGFTDATLHIKEVPFGRIARRTLSVQYFSHAQIVEDESIMFVLDRPEEDGLYFVRSLRMMDSKPQLARSCDGPA
jgi:hypothetical protein